MLEVITLALAIAASGFLGYHAGKEAQREETCVAANGVFAKNKCYFHMEEKKQEKKE